MSAAQLFRVPAEHGYLDTATYGLPPRATSDALHRALLDWERGKFDWQQAEADADQARTLFAQLINTTAASVALVPSASTAASIVADTLTQGEIVVCPNDHPSVTLPLVDIARRRGLKIREAAFHRLAEAVSQRTCLVACSHVHYVTGEVADVHAIDDAATAVGAATYLDVTQSVGVLPLDMVALNVEYVACAGYKWLCCPRGTGFLYVTPQQLSMVDALAPSRRATSTPLEAVSLANTLLSPDTSKLDFSLAWLPWIGARHSIQAILSLSEDERGRLSISLASHLAELLELPRPKSPICPVPVKNTARAHEALAAAHLAVSVRGETIRVSPYVSNSIEEIERVAEELSPMLRPRAGS
jgi:selenocysteine lyase/cysteine desulfurase